jgi:hypothetical protein
MMTLDYHFAIADDKIACRERRSRVVDAFMPSACLLGECSSHWCLSQAPVQLSACR